MRSINQSSYPGNRPEARVLLLCLRPSWGQDCELDLQGLLDDHSFGWERLLALAHAHQLLGLLFFRLNHCAPERLTGKVLELLRAHYECNRQRHLFLSQRLIELLGLFGLYGISVITFKGPVLAQLLYEDPGLRYIGDLDLLVSPHDVLKAKSVLLANGYRTEKLFNGLEEKEYLRLNSQYHFIDPLTELCVEIHWRFLPSHCFDPLVSEVWQRARPCEVGGVAGLRLASEDELIYLCLHAQKHTWDSLRYLADLARFVHQPRAMDWAEVKRRAGRLSLQQAVDEAFFLLNAWLDVETPAPLQVTHAARRRLAARAALIRGRVFRERWGLPGFTEWRAYLRDGSSESGKDSTHRPGMLMAAEYLALAASKIMQDRNYLMPAIPPFLFALRPLIWRVRHHCFSALESIRRRG